MEDFVRDEKTYLAQTYSRQPILIVEGKGVMVKDNEGKEYIDGFSGIAVNNLGHCHPAVVKAIQDQAKKLIHTSNVYYTEPQIKLAKLLFKISGGYKSFFCNSGAEANEAAIKIVRKFTGKSEIIACVNSFHGRTIATLSATGQDKYKRGFDPLLKEFKHVPFGDANAIKKAINEKTAAVMLEPIQGEGGVVVPPKNYLKTTSKICRDNRIIFILDEVQTGFGRTGNMFAWQGEGFEPDIFTLAKALGAGMPIGAMLAKKEVMSAFQPGDHASTFGGNPVACAAAVASINTILNAQLVDSSREIGAYFISRLTELKKRFPFIKDIRGRGLLIGLELDFTCHGLVTRALDKGLLLNCAHGNVLRFAPHLIIDRAIIDKIIDILETIFSEEEHGHSDK